MCPKGSPRKPIIQTWEVGRRSAHLKLNKAVLHYLEPCPNVVSQCQMRPITGTYNTFIRPTYGTKRWHFETAPLSARSGPRAPTCQPTVAQSIEWVQLWKIQIVNDRMHCVLDIKGPRLFKNIWATIAIEHMGHLRLTSILYGPDKSWHSLNPHTHTCPVFAGYLDKMIRLLTIKTHRGSWRQVKNWQCH